MQALKEEFQLLIQQLVFYTTQQLLLLFAAFCWQINHIFILKQAEKAQSNKLIHTKSIVQFQSPTLTLHIIQKDKKWSIPKLKSSQVVKM